MTCSSLEPSIVLFDSTSLLNMILLGNKSITLGALNCQGLADKVDLPEFADLLGKMDICGVSETWLNAQKADEISMPGFNFYPFNRKTVKGAIRGGGGNFY